MNVVAIFDDWQWTIMALVGMFDKYLQSILDLDGKWKVRVLIIPNSVRF